MVRLSFIPGSQPMKTVKFNKRAIAALAGGFLLIVGTLTLLSTGTSSEIQSDGIVVRDAKNRQSIQKISGESEFHGKSGAQHPKPLRLDGQKEKEKENVNPILGDTKGGDKDNEARKEKMVEMMLHAWYGYKNHTWGLNEIRPISLTANNQGIFGGEGMGATIVDAADTLYIMGLKEEYADARDWIRDNFDIKTKATGSLSLFETTIRFLGGMLSLYALTGEEFYIKKAQDIGDALLPAFKSETGIPYSTLNVRDKRPQNYAWANGGSSILAEIGTLHLEFVYLSKITKQPIFGKKVQKVRDVLDKAEKTDGLFPNYISPRDGRFSGNHISLGALGDSFYEYLIKSWIQTNYKDEQARRMHWDTSEKIQEKMIFKSSPSQLTYLVELRNGQPEHHMGHLACFAVGMFALEAHYEKVAARKEKVMHLAEELGKTCHESYVRSESGIGPDMMYFMGTEEATSKNSGPSGYFLRPEVIEGFFYLWRLTGKQMYRDWVWTSMMNIEKHCRKEGGYAGLQNVNRPDEGFDDVQQSFFLAETLKYAYLTFADNSVISLDEWVFNTEAHPLPIIKD